ncbi:putative Sec13/Seh1 family protein [Helianthus anomalus]
MFHLKTIAYSNGLVKDYEILDSMELDNSQLQPDDNNDRVCALAWPPNIGRPYELIAVATSNGLSIWKMASNPDHNRSFPVENVVTFPCHDNEVYVLLEFNV